MSKLYGNGAAVVIVGAMFKIQHWPGADIMLIAGLSTEAIIFGLSAMEPLHAEPNWAVYYPYLLPEDERPEGQDVNAFPKPHEIGGGKGSGGTTEMVAEMMEKAKIDQALAVITDLLETGNYDSIVFSANETKTDIGTGIFDVGADVRAYVFSQLFAL